MKKIGFLVAILAVAAVALSLRVYRFSAPVTLDSYTADPVSQLPPGLHSDEAYNALGGWRILHTGQWLPYSDIDQGRSVMHMTLTALVIALLGPVAESARVTSLLVGLASILGMVWLMRVLFRSRLTPRALNILTFIAALEMAATYWFVHFSRAGFELITLPLFIILACAALWQWLHHPTWIMSSIAGALLGLTLYTYYAAYAAPVVVMVGIGAYLVTERGKLPLRQLGGYAAAFGLMALPLVLYAVTYPDLFLHRVQDTAATADTALVDNVMRTLGGLVVNGDVTPTYNLPGRPLLDPVQAVLMLIGLGVCVRRIKQPEFFFVLWWLIALLLPGMLSNGAPAFNRLAGAVPAVIIVVALGATQLYEWLARLRWRWVAPLTLVGLLAFTAVKTAYDYFEMWPHTKGLLTTFSMAERIQAEAIKAQGATQQIYLSPSDNQRSIFAYLWQEQPLAKSFNGRRCTIIPRRTVQDTQWVIQALEDKRTTDRLAALYPISNTQAVWVDTGSVVVERLAIGAGESAQVPTTTLATLGDLFRLRDYRLIDPPTRGGRLRARLLWEPIGSTADDWTIATYLMDSAGQIRAQEDRQPCDGSYPTSRWQSAELISDDRLLTIPEDLPAGQYRLAIVVYRLSDNARLPVRGPADQPLGDTLFLETVTVP